MRKGSELYNSLMIHVSNRGHGGCDEQHPAKGFTHADIERVNKWCATNLPVKSYESHGDKFEYPTTLEVLCNDLLARHLLLKEVNRMRKRFASKVIFKVGRDIREIGYKGLKAMSAEQFKKLVEHVKTKFPQALILNDLNDDQLLEVVG